MTETDYRSTIQKYFKDKYKQTLSDAEADRLVLPVRTKLLQLRNVDGIGVIEAISHVLQVRILAEKPRIPLPEEAADAQRRFEDVSREAEITFDNSTCP